jgi:hypothetical protein
MNGKFQGTKYPSQVSGMHHKYSLYHIQPEIQCRFKGNFIPIQKSHISGPCVQDMGVISDGHIMYESNVSGLQEMMISNRQL